LRRASREKAFSASGAEALPAKDGPVEERLHRQELQDDISRALLRLPKRQVTAVVMRDILELPYKEIGDALECSETTARAHVNRAHKKLSNLLAHQAPSH
jgi:RNA polymerase sigma factor (sigma-70 family)